MTKEEAKDKKSLFYVNVWEYSVGTGSFVTYAFTTREEAEDFCDECTDVNDNPQASYTSYKGVQSVYGNNFCIFLNTNRVCTRQDAVEVNQLSGDAEPYI